MLEGGVEVERIELDEDVGIEHYAGVPEIDDERLEIQSSKWPPQRAAAVSAGGWYAPWRTDTRTGGYSRTAGTPTGSGRRSAGSGWISPEGRPEFHNALFIQPAH